MARKIYNYKYLVSLYSRVDEFLSNENIARDELPDAIVSFCTVVEKIFKLKLHKKNPLLIFEGASIKEDDALSIIALIKDKIIETARMPIIINRFGIIFKKLFTPDEFQALKDVYNVRNAFMHGYKPDDKIDFDSEDVVKKMGTIWEKISKVAISLLGKENIKSGKPKKKYSEKELEEVLEKEVKKMIKPLSHRNYFGGADFTFVPMPLVAPTSLHDFASFGEQCPRCGSPSFALDRPAWQSYGGFTELDGEASLFKCKNCHLELTEKQYEIAKKINN